MANNFFDAYRLIAFEGATKIDWEADDIRQCLVDTAVDDPVITTDDYFNTIAAGGRTAVTAATTGPFAVAVATNQVSVGAAHGGWTWSSVSGDQSAEIVTWKYNATETSALLLIRWDTFSSGMPVSPNTGDITVSVNASGLFLI